MAKFHGANAACNIGRLEKFVSLIGLIGSKGLISSKGLIGSISLIVYELVRPLKH